MSDYTPTTEEVRAAFRKGSRLGWNSRRGRLFDRWLEQVQAEVWDEGRNAFPVIYGEDHDVYCSEYECFCGIYVNPYREETE